MTWTSFLYFTLKQANEYEVLNIEVSNGHTVCKQSTIRLVFHRNFCSPIGCRWWVTQCLSPDNLSSTMPNGARAVLRRNITKARESEIYDYDDSYRPACAVYVHMYTITRNAAHMPPRVLSSQPRCKQPTRSMYSYKRSTGPFFFCSRSIFMRIQQLRACRQRGTGMLWLIMRNSVKLFLETSWQYAV